VEALRLDHPHPQLPGLLPRQQPEPPRPHSRLRRPLILLHRRSWLGVDVVGLARPPQQRRPPFTVPVGAEPWPDGRSALRPAA
jgi:hypothetical protein